MLKPGPTYNFTPEIRQKLNQFILQSNRGLIGIENFSEEFSGIDDFVSMALADKSDRDDHELRRSHKNKYYLELASFVLYDQLNRKAFNESKETLIILPDCISIHDKECEKVDSSYGDVCKGCNENCQAFLVRQLAVKYKAKALFSKRKLEEQLKHFDNKSESLGVIGIACILMLAPGMRAAAEIGIPTRGVPLNFCGCEHWNDKPFASEFDLTWLQSILVEKYGF